MKMSTVQCQPGRRGNCLSEEDVINFNFLTKGINKSDSEKELNDYLHSNVIFDNVVILEWWKQREKLYPRISKMFSQCSQIVSKFHCDLKDGIFFIKKLFSQDLKWFFTIKQKNKYF